MQRGDIYSAVGKGDFSRKPRPVLIVQNEAFNQHHPSITVCLITSDRSNDFLHRVAIDGDAATGLRHDSEVQIDKVQAIEIRRFGGPIGRAPDEVMMKVDEALRTWLDL